MSTNALYRHFEDSGEWARSRRRPFSRAVRWAKVNLFSSAFNTILTLLSAALLYAIASPIVGWALLDATFSGSSRAACTSDGACWTFVAVHLNQFLFGYYPPEEQWRVLAVLGLFISGLAAVAISGWRYKAVLALGSMVLVPVAAYYLLYGGGLSGLPVVGTDRWGGLTLTLLVAVSGISMAFPLGVLLALGRRSRKPVVRLLSVIYIEVSRSVPMITVLFMASLMLPLFMPGDMTVDKLVRALIGIAIFNAGHVAEVVRGGLQAVPRGQYEAAAALGHRLHLQMLLVILPQALTISIPGLVGTFISLLKDTSLLVVIGLFDLLGVAQSAVSDPAWLGFSAEGYVFIAALFWVMCFAMSKYSRKLERRLGVHAPRLDL
ncbi:MAG: amino acid ABC transporter permease [Parvibaculaceae bacterium]|jgi:general L-amino acid transport system permease protein